MKKETKARWMLLSVIGGLLLSAWIIATLMSSNGTIEKDTWADRDDEAMTILKNCAIPGTQTTILRLTRDYLDAVKASGSFIEFKGWYAFQVHNNKALYEAGVGYKVNGARQTAKWDVDLSLRKIKPRNQMAFIFSGNNDFLHY